MEFIGGALVMLVGILIGAAIMSVAKGKDD